MLQNLYVLICFLVLSISGAFASPPLEAYGKLPSFRSVAISPSGNRVVFLRQDGENEYAGTYDYAEGKTLQAVSTNNVKASNVFFITDQFAILRASKTTRTYGFRNEYEYTTAFSWNLETGEIEQLLAREDELFPAQSGLGRIVGKLEGEDTVFMPAYVGSAYSDPNFDLLKVNLKTGRARTHKHGRKATIDWLVDKNGDVIAREDYHEQDDLYSIWVYPDGQPRKIFEEKVKIRRMSLLGVKPDKSALVVAITSEETGRDLIAEMSFNGELSKPLFERANADVERVLSDSNRYIYGVQYSGMTPSYEFFDQELTKLLEDLQPLYPYAAITLSDWSDGFEKLVLHVGGGDKPPAYFQLDTVKKQISKIASVYEDIGESDVGSVFVIEFKARDGASIPSLLTIPPGAEMKGRHPTIILPHGGPEAYDKLGFDWMAQFFASRGYAVMQPNFRGSAGFGADWVEAGEGEWGRGVMQNDVTDALGALIKGGIADPDRVCIVGGSYGGYAALAGGAFTPELYDCVAAIAPVSDLPRMMFDERRDNGRDSWVISYWTKLIGDVSKERDKLESISPANYASEFQAPVLLIHGDDDTVVPFRQSDIMESALKKANKDVELVRLRGGDHWLSTSETRLATLRALDAFVAKHIGGGAVAVAGTP